MDHHIIQLNIPTVIRFGAGAIKELPGYLKSKGLERPLVVTDGTIAELDFFKKKITELEKSGLSVRVFSDTHKNPVKSDVYRGVELWDDTDRDAVIGIGGGAALDIARAITLRVYHREDLFKYDDLIGGDVFITGPVPPFITVPTTAGTGSEVGRSAIIADDETHRKRILFSPKLMADIVFADPELMISLPPSVTAATGMDALTHNLEAFLAKNYNPICDGIALEGIRILTSSLENGVKKPDLQVRSQLLMGSMMGAIAFQKGLGVVHSLAHPLSSLLDTHHGLANAVNLPYGMRFNIAGNEQRFERIAQAMNLPQHSGESVIHFIETLNASIGIPENLRTLGVEDNQLETLADLAIADFAHPNNPKPVSRQDFLSLYREAW